MNDEYVFGLDDALVFIFIIIVGFAMILENPSMVIYDLIVVLSALLFWFVVKSIVIMFFE